MAISAALTHVSTYKYSIPVTLGPQVVRLRPAPHCRTPIPAYSLKVTPADTFVNWQQDPYGNFLARLVFQKPVREFTVSVDLVADLTVINPFDFFLEEYAEFFPFEYEADLRKQLEPYLEILPDSPLLDRLMEEVPRERQRTTDFLVVLNQLINSRIKYLIRMEPGVQTPDETLGKCSGSCRDSGWLLVQVARRCGLAARFVSGYSIQLAPDKKPLTGPPGPDNDIVDLHAWAEIFVPGAGWIGLDATSGLFAGEGHIPLACTPDPSAAAPITGGFSPEDKESSFSVVMKETRIYDRPRTTKPYTDEQWDGIVALGDLVEKDLLKNDIRLTMGGEPTFISVDDFTSPEWTTAALGAHKRQLAGRLFNRLQKRFAPGALLHFGQGKWYPGEQLPRWALGCYWRKDGVPAWRDHNLIADFDHPAGSTAADSERFAQALSERLEIGPRWLMPAFEDAWYHLWRERRLPANVDPYKSRLDDAEERASIAKIFTQGLGATVGHVLPLRRNAQGWSSGPWFLRQERLMLLPGDSPIGFRLPLDSLPWATASDRAWAMPVDRDPYAPRPPLPVFERRIPAIRHPGGTQGPQGTPVIMPGGGSFPGGPGAPHGGDVSPESSSFANPDPTRTPRSGESASWITRTALCLEPRGGILHVFMPPQDTLESYLELAAAVEDCAAATGIPVALEGYTPPRDPRLNVLSVTPDPGVIEVNIHPQSDWSSLVDTTTALYEEAHQTRLATEKFMLDGRHTGTGGGNHITMGGATPADSPFLRRPDVLRSFVSYWHNHPSLSYLFSGLFIGPTSQAPRADEGRFEAVYELETALDRLPDHAVAPPWLVDRVLRNLLTDLTGNTHRTEFCIDKLYSPDSSTGRLGIVEMRAFEMPPDAKMSLAQQLLVRSLLSRFWQQPYHASLVRWGTQLHDRFMLPHFVKDDFSDVMTELKHAGYAFDPAWFDVHHEFRFPRHGEVVHRGVRMELRHALEPWNVLGEEPAGGGTARFVDSSVERVQMKVDGMVDSRHVVTCNGHPLPLHPTGTNGEFVCGVRYRAWQPPSCLHPTIPVHAPLVFDLVDTWSGRAVGGCTYHVSHPGGRSYEIPPVNANEAEARRVARFLKYGHTPGPVRVPAGGIDRDYPFTLDLRRV